MFRILYAVILSFTVVGMGLLSDGFGDSESTFQTWLVSFILPLWSILTVSLWHDTGRFIWSKRFENSTDFVRSSLFITWMSFVITYVVWVHISLFAIPMLIVIPVLGYFLREFLTHDWMEKFDFKLNHGITILIWSILSYLTYWILTFSWIVFRVWWVGEFENGIVYFVR